MFEITSRTRAWCTIRLLSAFAIALLMGCGSSSPDPSTDERPTPPGTAAGEETADETPEAPVEAPEPAGEEEAPDETAGGAESAEEKMARLEEEASSKGLFALIGSAGDSSTGDAVADLLSEANSLSADVGAALANSSGIAIARRDSEHRAPPEPAPTRVDPATEAHDALPENPFTAVAASPLSTFSIDVDTAGYANVRRMLNQGYRPPPDAVRIEELVNYFSYDDAPPRDGTPFAVHSEVASCPWKPEHRLLRIGIKGRELDLRGRPSSNLVFLLDVSGSMNQPNKLPLLRRSLTMMMGSLDARDRVAIVVYAGASGLVLPSTSADRAEVIVDALERLSAGGSTNGGAGIELAYRIATENYIQGGTNRVILATDGDFNVGTTSRGALEDLIQEKAKTGVELTVLGFGMGNFQDSTLEQLADKGNGNYGYIDGLAEARKLLVQEIGGTLVTIAKDVKIQAEFNPGRVQAWRLIGYENRVLAAQDFNDDKKDAGEIGAGHSLTALYELVPPNVPIDLPGVDGLRYQAPPETSVGAASDELLFLKLRYKDPGGDTSRLLQFPVRDRDLPAAQASGDLQFAAAVASFGMLLRGSPHAGSATWDSVLKLAKAGLGRDLLGYRAGFLELVERARNVPERGQSPARVTYGSHGGSAPIRGKLTLGGLDIDASVEEQSSIAKTLKRYTGRLKQCYERQLKGNPVLAGQVVLALWIEPDGNVASGDDRPQLLENTTKDTVLRDCLLREAGRIRFVPAPGRRTQIRRYLLDLEPQ